MLWHHLITREVLEACEDAVEHGWEVDTLLLLNGGATNRLHVAEVLSRAASTHGIDLPTRDKDLAFLLRHRKDTANPALAGALTITHDGRIGYNLGNGRTAESTGTTLTIIRSPELTRYAHGYRFRTITNY